MLNFKLSYTTDATSCEGYNRTTRLKVNSCKHFRGFQINMSEEPFGKWLTISYLEHESSCLFYSGLNGSLARSSEIKIILRIKLYICYKLNMNLNQYIYIYFSFTLMIKFYRQKLQKLQKLKKTKVELILNLIAKQLNLLC